MSLKRRNLLAYVLILLAALGWTVGQKLVSVATGEYPMVTTAPGIQGTAATGDFTIWPTTAMESTMVTWATGETGQGIHSVVEPETLGDSRGNLVAGFVLSVVSAAVAVLSVLLLWQRSPLLGPDGVALLLALMNVCRRTVLIYGAGEMALNFCLTALALCCVRELWGWLRSRFSLRWCLAERLAGRLERPQYTLCLYCVWLCLMTVCLCLIVLRWDRAWISVGVYVAVAGGFGLLCLWRYGADLWHFRQQLDNFQSGASITVKDGAFAGTERKLLEIQAGHEEAIRTAVTSERFKVELIANVSHDLRTPLTAILGYSELLQKEKLTDEGEEQLRQLTRKAGYMRELVESLFELTKVSSGVLESKKEKLDLLRLLEQTMGLFDDQLSSAGLQVRRHYALTDAPVVTDGSRMHQVFANLLGNAIKYALPGTRIHLEVKADEERYTVRMSNIASYEMDFHPEEITERFVRGDKARTTRGSGIGLAIARTYTESVGGVFRVAVDGDQFSAIVELPKN